MEPIPSSQIVLMLRRKWFTNKSTIGELFVGFEPQCFTLEDTVRNGAKVAGETAIPAGRYEICFYNSPKHGMVPLLMDVPGFECIEIHPGNKPEDTRGCILVGKTRQDDQPDFIFESRAAFKELMTVLEPAMKSGKIYLEIVGAPQNGTAGLVV